MSISDNFDLNIIDPCTLAFYTSIVSVVEGLKVTVTPTTNVYAFPDCTAMVDITSMSFLRELDQSEYQFDGALLVLTLPGDLEMDFYFNENTDVAVYVPHALSVPVCPVTSFIENTPDPYYIDELTVLLPELEYMW